MLASPAWRSCKLHLERGCSSPAAFSVPPFFTSRLHTQPPVIGSLLYNDTIDLAHLSVDFFVTGHNLVWSWSWSHGARLSAQLSGRRAETGFQLEFELSIDGAVKHDQS